MSLLHWLLFMFIAVLSILPLAMLDLFNVSKKYTYFKYLSIFLLVWTLITGLRYVVNNPYVVYYTSLTVYPLLYLLTVTIFIAILNFLEKKIPKLLLIFFAIFLILDIAISYTNDIHQLMLKIVFSQDLTYTMVGSADHGIFFYIHTGVCYLILFFSLISISVRLYRNLRKDRDVMPFTFMVLSIILGVVINFIHLFFIEFKIDPTYIVFVLVTSLLYLIFCIRDLKLILKINSNEFILDNLREMYLLVNQRGMVVAVSCELGEKFNIDVDNGLSFNDFKRIISDKTIVYTDSKNLEKTFMYNKMYLHMIEKDIKFPFLKQPGKFYLFFDETENQKNIYELNYVMTHDLMTKIYNRNYFETLESEIEENYDNYALVMFDVDGLKLFNDYLGHEAGDQLLIRFANALKILVDKYENLIPIRMGGDEFLLIILNKDRNDIEEIIYELKTITNDKNMLKHIGFSYGYGQNNYANKPFRRVLLEADSSQYDMKTTRKEFKEKLEDFFKTL